MVTEHYYEHELARIHYHKFGCGARYMLCFHGYGMHGQQFTILEKSLGNTYTFFGLDLFFHKETKLKNHCLANIKKGLTKQDFSNLIADFCKSEYIKRFSVIGYSMGSHYATAVVEELAWMVEEYIVAAPSCLNPGILISCFSTNKLGNKLLEKIMLNEKMLMSLLRICKKLCIIDNCGYDILCREIASAELRFAFYACVTYLRYLKTNKKKLATVLTENAIKCIFVFGKRDAMYPPRIGRALIAKLSDARTLVLDETHDLINQAFALELSRLLT